jgi:hypothetical protein
MGPGIYHVHRCVLEGEVIWKTHTESGWSQTQDLLHGRPSSIVLLLDQQYLIKFRNGGTQLTSI